MLRPQAEASLGFFVFRGGPQAFRPKSLYAVILACDLRGNLRCAQDDKNETFFSVSLW